MAVFVNGRCFYTLTRTLPERLLRWAEDFGPVRCAGVEGTSSYGAGLARHLRARGIEVLEVERPKRRRRSSRRNVEKSDPSDADGITSVPRTLRRYATATSSIVAAS